MFAIDTQPKPLNSIAIRTNSMKIFPLIILTIIISGCVPNEKIPFEDNVGESCVQHSDCKLPMDYAIQSNCAFGTACIDSICKVVCPLYYHEPNPEVSKSYPFTCKEDSDCDCSERGKRTIECRCVDEKCVSVEAE